ncbi:MAG: TetR/AcrR family transcriptional regulator C-terminal domain-containing protein [Chloroflexota bacterium]
MLLAHRDAARVLLDTPPVGPHRLGLIERSLSVLREAGFPDDAVTEGSAAFNAYVTGAVLDETRGRPGQGSDGPSEEDIERFTEWWRSLPADRYPTLVALGERLLNADLDRRFAVGLGALLDGLERRRPAGR